MASLLCKPAGSACLGVQRPSQRRLLVACKAKNVFQSAAPAAAGMAIATAMLLGSAGTSWASREKVGEFAASGFLFKDTVEVNAIDDDEVPGITIYISDFKRSLADKLAKDFFTEPSQASLTCSTSGPLQPVDLEKMGGREGKEMFSERKGFSLFKDKTLRVRRIYDPDRHVMVYVAYSTRLTSASDDGGPSTGRYRTSLCAIPMPVPAPPVVAAPAP